MTNERGDKQDAFALPLAALDPTVGRAALDRLHVAVEGLLLATGLDEDAMVAELSERAAEPS